MKKEIENPSRLHLASKQQLKLKDHQVLPGLQGCIQDREDVNVVDTIEGTKISRLNSVSSVTEVA